jgi:uncharacterized protein
MTHHVTVHFHDEINFFLPEKHRDTPIEHPVNFRVSIKDLLESLGPPHTEMSLIVVNGVSVDFNHIVEPGSHIDVYPDFDAIDLPHKVALRPSYTGKPTFVLDTHLGKLANTLRLMGYDTLYRNDYPDDELAQVSDTEGRILLTRDIGLLKRGRVLYGYYVRATDPHQKLIEVTRRYNLLDDMRPFSRCITCNGLLQPVEKATIIDQLPEQSAQAFDEFAQCDSCSQVFWKGSHYDRMQDIIAQLRVDVTLV